MENGVISKRAKRKAIGVVMVVFPFAVLLVWVCIEQGIRGAVMFFISGAIAVAMMTIISCGVLTILRSDT